MSQGTLTMKNGYSRSLDGQGDFVPSVNRMRSQKKKE